MEDSTRLTESTDHHHGHHHHHHHHHHHQHVHNNHHSHHHRRDHRAVSSGGGGGGGGGGCGGNRAEFGDDECSTDSGCSSGGSTGSAERLSRRGSGERLCRAGRSPRSHCYLDRLRGRPTRSQERLSSVQRSAERTRAKSSRSWSPGDARSLPRGGGESPSFSPSPSDAHSSSDSDSLKRPSTAETLRRAFQSLKISSRWESKEKKHPKKSPKRILRSPVSYRYVKGLSGLPTQRVPRNATQQLMMPCSCQESIGFYR